MSHGVHAVQHEVEHKIEHDGEHGGGGHGRHRRSRNKKIALLIAVIALFLAFSETLGKSAQTAALSYNIEASNLWNFFQAKTIRRTVRRRPRPRREDRSDRRRRRSGRDQGGDEQADRRLAEDRGALRLRAEDRRGKEATQRRRRRRELMARAIAAEAKRDTALAKYHHYEVASAAFQIGIVLASATVITGMMVLTYLAGGLGVVGLGFMAIGLFAPHAVHLF